MKENIYTDVKDAKKEIFRRWEDSELAKSINDYLGGDVPAFLNDRPFVALFRNIMTPNNETRRCLEISKEIGIGTVGFEFAEDKFVAHNKDKHSLVILPFDMGKKPDGKEKIARIKAADINSVQGKNFSSIPALWGENLVDFHHNILHQAFPEFSENVHDISDWLDRNGGRARKFYEKFMVLLLRNCVLAEHYNFHGDEGKFTDQVVIPAFKNAENIFGIRPLIVQLAPEEWENNPAWWYYRPEAKEAVEKYIKK